MGDMPNTNLFYWNPADVLGEGHWDPDNDDYKEQFHKLGDGNIGEQYYLLGLEGLDRTPVAEGVVRSFDIASASATIEIRAAPEEGFQSSSNMIPPLGVRTYRVGDEFQINPEWLVHRDSAPDD